MPYQCKGWIDRQTDRQMAGWWLDRWSDKRERGLSWAQDKRKAVLTRGKEAMA